MNRLQKRAWVELAAVTSCFAVGSTALAILVHLDSKGLDTLMIGLIVGLIAGLIIALRGISANRRLDERERRIVEKAFQWACVGFILPFALTAFIMFFAVGGKGHVPVYTLPALLFACLFVAQFVQSTLILVQCAMEQPDE